MNDCHVKVTTPLNKIPLLDFLSVYKFSSYKLNPNGNYSFCKFEGILYYCLLIYCYIVIIL